MVKPFFPNFLLFFKKLAAAFGLLLVWLQLNAFYYTEILVFDRNSSYTGEVLKFTFIFFNFIFD